MGHAPEHLPSPCRNAKLPRVAQQCRTLPPGRTEPGLRLIHANDPHKHLGIFWVPGARPRRTEAQTPRTLTTPHEHPTPRTAFNKVHYQLPPERVATDP
jgi:hypothetical protein